MDSIPVINTDGKTDSSATVVSLSEALKIARIDQYEEAKRIKRNDIARLRNYLFKQFELYQTMKIDHKITFSNCHVLYDSKDDRFVDSNGQVFYRISQLAWHLRLHYGIRSQNGKNEWVILESNSNSGLKS